FSTTYNGGRSDVFVAKVAVCDAVRNTTTMEKFCTIQAAIDDGDTRDGHTLEVSAGVYSELVDVYKSVRLIGAGAGTTTIEATPDVSSSNEMAIIQVRDGKSAEITGFKIAGPGPDACGSILTGIFVREGATANIHDNTITAIRDDDGNSTCQNGFGIFVGRKLVSTTGTATITNNTLTGYQKGGIIVDNTGSNATLSNNIITGSGSNNHVAQNGVQISRGATATFTGNDISLHQFSGSTWIATGVLLYDAGNVTINNNNLIHDNGYGIYIRSTGARSSEADGPQPVPFDAEFDDLMNQGRSADAITAGTMAINNNRIYGNAVYGAFATGISGIDGRCNWWGSAGGPSGGDKVNTNIVYTPFRTTNNMDDSCALRLGDSDTAKWTLFLPVTR
ncbi:MAG: right-handed parallel beta-helix repeat-containing protein, partial [Candidatus Promineofilum sp.]|nr:right-handed parallel beta-helix repeat-containing protein [Promineifilum sp.]